jgi:hypothetical protein
MGIEDVASFAGCTNMEDRATIRSTLSRTKSAFWKPSGLALGRPELNQNVLALDPAALPQA